MGLLFWERVNKAIKINSVKQEWLAEKTGIKYQTLRSWVSKDILPRVDDAVKIAGELGVTVEYLVMGTNSGVSKEIDNFYVKYKKFSIVLEYLELLNQEQREDIEAFALTLVEKKQALEARKHTKMA
ncbi:MAG: helix-turn-helix domain-containing protein [Treponema sp.]|jgi:transcriptional regulator with XRE-family HTH domain|nr:helix-turn-helix domain-containing protein [Treponema sp.]